MNSLLNVEGQKAATMEAIAAAVVKVATCSPDRDVALAALAAFKQAAPTEVTIRDCSFVANDYLPPLDDDDEIDDDEGAP